MTLADDVPVAAEMPVRFARLARRVLRFWRFVGTVVAVQLVLTIGILLAVFGVVNDTNEDQDTVIATLQGQVATIQETNRVLAERNADLAAELAVAEDLQGQAVDHVERLALQVIELGGDPGIIRIEPSEDQDG